MPSFGYNIIILIDTQTNLKKQAFIKYHCEVFQIYMKAMICFLLLLS